MVIVHRNIPSITIADGLPFPDEKLAAGKQDPCARVFPRSVLVEEPTLRLPTSTKENVSPRSSYEFGHFFRVQPTTNRVRAWIARERDQRSVPRDSRRWISARRGESNSTIPKLAILGLQRAGRPSRWICVPLCSSIGSVARENGKPGAATTRYQRRADSSKSKVIETETNDWATREPNETMEAT